MSKKAGTVLSRHFRLERLTDGVYACVHKDGGWAISNAGIIDIGKQTLVFDTCLTPQAACDLRDGAKVLTGRTPDYVINSHYHNDHIRGSQVFKETVLVSTTRTRELILSQGKAELEADREQAVKRLTELKAFAQSRDKERRKFAAFFLPYWEGILASLPKIKLRLPELTFERQLTFHGTKRTAQLIEVNRGHTESDCLLFLPQEGVVFCGDLLFVRGHPYLGDGDPQNLLSILDQLEGFAAKVYVPGHGLVGKIEDLNKLRLYIRTLMRLAQEAVARGNSVEDLVKQPVPESFTDWILAQPFYEANLRFLYGLLVKS